MFLGQLTAILRNESASSSATGDSSPSNGVPAHNEIGIARAASNHGSDLLLRGFPVDQVVHDYGDLCQAITDLAIEQNAPIAVSDFRTLNRCLDDAIADAVSGFAQSRDQVITDTVEKTMNERLGILAHELRNQVNTAILAVAAIKQGSVGISGATGAVLDRSLRGLQELCARALVDVRVRAGIPQHRERAVVSSFIEEVRVSAAIDANARGVEFIVPDVESGLAIDVDRQILAGAVINILKNAFKFTRLGGRVSLKAFSWKNSVLIEVEDECGGLPPGDPDELFQLFEQRSTDRSGSGLGLGISRRGVEANGGQLHVRNLPNRGCVFTIVLPKAALLK